MKLTNQIFSFGGESSQTNIVGISPETLEAIIRQHGEYSKTQRREIERLQVALNVTHGQIRAALEILDQAQIPTKLLDTKFIEVIERFRGLLAAALAHPDDTQTTAQIKDEARKAIEVGELARADELLAKAQAEQGRALNRAGIALAETAASRGALAMTRLRYEEAVAHFAYAASTLVPNGPYEDKRLEFLALEADALYQQGDEFGNSVALGLAVERQKDIITLSNIQKKPSLWAQAHNNLGRALSALGDRESGVEYLDEAAAAHSEALKVYSQENDPWRWALTQNNLGKALLALGDRLQSSRHLSDSVVAFREALKEWSHNSAPTQWAGAQNNLGFALLRLGELKKSTKLVIEAQNAVSEALRIWTPESAPLDWAMAQNNLGLAFAAHGVFDRNVLRLWQAVAAYKKALEKRTKERVPLEWAATKNNLGTALAMIGERERDVSLLTDATSAFRAALSEFTGDRTPFQNAGTQKNLEKCLATIDRLRDNKIARIRRRLKAIGNWLRVASARKRPPS